MQDNALFSGKVHSWRKFTQPPVATAVTNQNSGQQMSPVFAFDKAAVAQKVNVQCCYRGPVWSEKVGGGGAVSLIGRDG